MNLSKIEKNILQHLTTNGAATVQELSQAVACSLSGVQNAMRTLRAANLIRQGDLKHVPGFFKRHRTYTANTAHTAVDENPLAARVSALEAAIENVTEKHNRMVVKFTDYTNIVSNYGGKVEQMYRTLRDYEAWLCALEEKIKALEPEAAVDPVYAEIERELTEKLTTFSPELLRLTIDNAYAEHTKQQGEN